MNKELHFLRTSLRSLRTTGSVTPSSPYLCRRIAQIIDADRPCVIAELGAGDGVITQYLLQRMHPDSCLLVFEINPEFVDTLNKRFKDPRLILIADSAERLKEHCERLGIEQLDYVVSAIPFVVLPADLRERIVGACKHQLREGGLFVQYHYSPLLLPAYRRIFGNLRLRLVARNIPPALLITCVKDKS